MEVWRLEHPRHGVLVLEQGFDAEFVELDADWPVPGKDRDEQGQPRNGVLPGANATIAERLRAWRDNPPRRLRVSVDGTVVGHYRTTSDCSLPMDRSLAPGAELQTPGARLDRSRPQLRVHANLLGEVLAVDFREGDQVVEFDPPQDSRARRRHDAMASSDVKRIAYPLLQGMGKVGWALAVLVLGPLLRRLLPDWHLDLSALPQVHLPVPHAPRIHLPVPQLPHIHLPVPHLDLPQVPAWLVSVLQHDELWKPLLIGLVAGVVALRNHRRSEAEKARWRTGASGDETSRLGEEQASAQDGATRPTAPPTPVPRD